MGDKLYSKLLDKVLPYPIKKNHGRRKYSSLFPRRLAFAILDKSEQLVDRI